MDNEIMIERLKNAGVDFEDGMSDAELDRAERLFCFKFPEEIRSFLSCSVPCGSSFFDFRDLSECNLKRFQSFQESIEGSFLFDLEHNRDTMLEMLGSKLGYSLYSESFENAVLQYLRQSVKLIPFFAHRCFFDGIDHMPIVSFWQATDTVIYGGSFQNYLEVEFLRQNRVLGSIVDQLMGTGIWADLID